MPKIFDLIKADNFKSIYEQDKNRQPYFGEQLFPNTRQRGLKFSFIKGKQGLPVSLVSSSFDANVLYRDRLGIETLSGTLPFFKEAMKINEETRQEILSTREEFLEPVINRVFDDGLELLDGADVAVERMRMQLISTGTISVVENGVNKQYDYGFDNAKQLKTETKDFDDESVNAIDVILNAVDAFEDLTNETATRIVMDKSRFKKLQANVQIQKHFQQLIVPKTPNANDVVNYVQEATGLELIVLNKKYIEARDNSKTPKLFYPADRFTILADGTLGDTVYGTTPEEADLFSGESKANSVAVTDKGVAITTWNEVDPVNVNTKVSEVVIPTAPKIDKLYIVKFGA